MATNSYPIDTQIIFTANFTTVGNCFTPIDPTDVEFLVKDPSGAITTYTYSGGQLNRLNQGVYTAVLTPSVSGTYTYKFQGIGAVVATTIDQQFIILSSMLIPG